MPNMVDVLERNFLAILNNCPEYADQTNQVRLDTYEEIIMTICKFYNLNFVGDFNSLSPEEIYSIGRTMYDIFIARFTDYMFNFFVSYIVNNADSIVSYLKVGEEYVKPKETGLYDPKMYIDPKFILIHANMNQVIYNMAGYDISLSMILGYFLNPVMAQKMSELLEDKGDIYKYHYASYILNPLFSADILTNVKLKFQAKTQEILGL